MRNWYEEYNYLIFCEIEEYDGLDFFDFRHFVA